MGSFMMRGNIGGASGILQCTVVLLRPFLTSLGLGNPEPILQAASCTYKKYSDPVKDITVSSVSPPRIGELAVKYSTHLLPESWLVRAEGVPSKETLAFGLTFTVLP